MNLKPAIVLAGVCSLLAARSVVADHTFAAEFRLVILAKTGETRFAGWSQNQQP